jgi:DNA-binding TFAR19-related protein (PDSD5 family)
MMPNFLVIGAQKAGTTSLYHYLKQHPEIYMSPIKEPHFFAVEGAAPDFRGPSPRNPLTITDLEAYRALFAGVSGETAIGEASPSYLGNPKAPNRIRHYIPEAKLIAILRNPVERAFSAYLHRVRDDREWFDFARALREEEARIKANLTPGWYYKRAGFYYPQLKRYYELFDREQIRVHLYEDLDTDPASMLLELFAFLNVDETFVPDTSLRHGVTGVPKSRILRRFLRGSNPVKSFLRPLFRPETRVKIGTRLNNLNLTKPQMSPEVREALIATYREDILKLQDLIRRDLSEWLEE